MYTKEQRKEYNKVYHRRRYDGVKASMMAYLGGTCTKCGSVDGLEFDHVERKDKSIDVLELWNRSWHIIQVELDKCQLLCKDCHADKTALEVRTTHGGGLSGINKCKCVLCKAQKRAYMQEYHKTHIRKRDRIK